MITVPAKVKDRIAAGLKRYQPILIKARDKDINESDTVTILMDVLADILGYDKYTEITSEYAIKHTYCDLAIKLDGSPRILIEVKAAGLDLKLQHIKQAVDYGSNSGVDWVILTNGIQWKVYKIIFAKPIDTELVYEFNLTEMNAKKAGDLEVREGLLSGGLSHAASADESLHHRTGHSQRASRRCCETGAPQDGDRF